MVSHLFAKGSCVVKTFSTPSAEHTNINRMASVNVRGYGIVLQNFVTYHAVKKQLLKVSHLCLCKGELQETETEDVTEDDPDKPQGVEIKDQPEIGKRPGQDNIAGTKNWNKSELKEPSLGELKETKTDKLMEDDSDEPQGVEIEDQTENKQRQGQAEDAESTNLDDSKLGDTSKGELKVTGKKELTEDDLGGDPDKPQEIVELKERPENGKRPGQEYDAGTKNWNESKLEEHVQGELKETIADKLLEDDPDEPQEGVEIEDQSEN